MVFLCVVVELEEQQELRQLPAVVLVADFSAKHVARNKLIESRGPRREARAEGRVLHELPCQNGKAPTGQAGQQTLQN
jgi:hypothetical protein